MIKGFFKLPDIKNEPVKQYGPGSAERAELQAKYDELWNSIRDIPMYIGGQEVRTGKTERVLPPHDHQHNVGHYHMGDASHVHAAIDAALKARSKWAAMSWEQRASIFLKAADLLAGPYRAEVNAATMIAQSKTSFQTEIDAACELIDFLRFNVKYMAEIYAEQPNSMPGVWNRMEYRPLEGFVFAVTPFNFTAISGNLPASAALMGNVVVWKPSLYQVYSAHVVMKVFIEAGLPAGVINMIMTDPAETAQIVLSHPDFAGIHFTGSTAVFRSIWKTIGENIHRYKSYPRIVGETGGKDYVWMHASADVRETVVALVRGAFELQGQKCSAASRAYIPRSRWNEVNADLGRMLSEIKMGSPRDFSNFVTAVIHEGAFDKIVSYIEYARKDKDSEIIYGGKYDKSVGYFIEPTVILTKNPKMKTMVEEIFGPVLTIYVYEDEEWEASLDLVNETSEYALTGAIFAKDRYVIEVATNKLVDSAGNFYINDKPTGAVVDQQPFGGARGSGTNDKAGSKLNLLRWVSARSIKETMVPPTDYTYPFMK
ncbi:L-glutamate gamma-semialdehyde dehydrogenase [Thermaurantimonas aggregans]|uniref:L-glutamate gamma-semialdehyde dehydrogenase n=1 Tax=Thermaurantimonas aggregans TaxID=2173829 RepID=UPI0023F2305F|nr:L-glutamate gamma-semialdehyde dehydrogenase [Thermaurantimonas aggregans]MCX8148652.1 L-glutamate gamma-semialdehyde dehydrogenase [Thermaurantimonas aggregans]